ncbi:hypothetical protein JL722_9743 [Aureococcus anophagefferens]|nr:hypothetical protein JL722_9743 [Aureococcus anophagefferens]
MSRFLFGLLACASASWTPELKLKKHGDQSKVSQEWGPAIRATLKASLHAYADKAISSPKAAAKLLAKTAERLDAVVAVLDNRVFVDEAFLEARREDGMRHLRSSPGALDGVPDVAYRFALHADDGAGGGDCRARARSSSSTSGGATAPAARAPRRCARAASRARSARATTGRCGGPRGRGRGRAEVGGPEGRGALARRRDGELDGGGRGDCVAGAPAPLLALGPPFLFDCEGACAFRARRSTPRAPELRGALWVPEGPRRRRRARAFLRDGLKSWRGTLLEVKFGDALALAETYQHESYTMVRAMLKAVGRDELMFVRAVAGDALAPTTAWRLHNWRPDEAVVDLHGDESARSDL